MSTQNPSAPPLATPETFAAVIVGVIPGLLAIFIPLLQLAPTKLTTAEVMAAVISGVTLLLTTLAAWLTHRSSITKTAMTLADNQAERDMRYNLTAAPAAVTSIRHDFDEFVPDVSNAVHVVLPGIVAELAEVKKVANAAATELNNAKLDIVNEVHNALSTLKIDIAPSPPPATFS